MNKLRLRDLLCASGAWLCAVSLVFWFLDLFRILSVTSAVRVLWVSVLIFVLLVLMKNRYLRIAILTGLALSLLVLLLFFLKNFAAWGPLLERFGEWLSLLPRKFGAEESAFVMGFAMILSAAVSLIFGVPVIAFRKAGLILPALLLSVTGVCFTYPNTTLHITTLLPAAIGLIPLLALTSKGEDNRARSGLEIGLRHLAVLAAMTLAIGSVMLTATLFERGFSAEKMRSDSFKKKIDNWIGDLKDAFDEPAPEPAPMFIFDPGFAGLDSENRSLGGPIQMTDDLVLEVTSPRDLLLKARTYDDYRVQYWDSGKAPFQMSFYVPDDAPYSIANRPDLSITPVSDPYGTDYLSFQPSFFDSYRPDRQIYPIRYILPIIEETDIVIRNASEMCGGTIFYPDHLIDAAYPDALSFNESASLYAENNLSVGDSYIVRAMVFRTNAPEFQSDLLALEGYIRSHDMSGTEISLTAEIRERYLNTNVPESVIDYATAIAADAVTPLEKAIAIRDHLSRNFTYSLDVTEVPSDRDFVEYFLETRKGYCVYFASAMCMMARANDIPARYVEGFYADVAENPSNKPSTVIVSSNEAHAWCEIYIEGIGWIPFDATPGSSGFAYGNPDKPETTEVTPTPTPSPSPDPTANPTEAPSPSPTKSPEPTGRPEPSGINLPPALLLAGILILAAATALIFALLYAYREKRYLTIPPLQKLSGVLSPNARLRFLYERCQNHLDLLGIRIASDESPLDFAKRVRSARASAAGCTHDMHAFDLYATASAYEKMIYGLVTPSEESIISIYDECRNIRKEVRGLHYSGIHYVMNIIFHRKGGDV